MAKMTVGSLKAILNDYDDERIIVLPSDDEGNSYSNPNAKAWGTGLVSQDMDYLSPERLSDKMIKDGWTEDDIIDDGIPCLVIG